MLVMAATKHETREGWLKEAVRALSGLLDQNGAKLPKKWAVSVGFPKGGFKVRPAIGECWDPEVSPDGTTHMFISPILEDRIQTLGTLLHEMIHAAVGLEEKHAGEFRRVARAVGLKGKLTATHVEDGTDLHLTLSKVDMELGDYPGTPMRPTRVAKPKGEYFLTKLVSPNDPSYKFTIAPRLIEEFGMPKDYMGDEMKVVEGT
jgi:hypothetical protein